MRVRPVQFHPEMKGFDTVLGESGFISTWYGTDDILQKSEVGVD